MNIYLNEPININNIIFQKPILNKIDNYKNFYKLLYTTKNFTMNYLLIPLNIQKYNIEYSNKKYKLTVNKDDHIFYQLFNIEKQILNNINLVVKKKVKYQCVFGLRNKKYLFVFHQQPDLSRLCLKISGIWENEDYIGIIYKLFYY